MATIRAKVDSIALLSEDDPPMWICNTADAASPQDEESRFCHPNHALALQQRAEKTRVDARVYAESINLQPPSYTDITMYDFMVKFLTKK